ncbi:MAG: hypothetical protein ACI8ZX_001336 [Planctomycetota bacterium]|jgi:uncharacterized protein (DUF885 family)
MNKTYLLFSIFLMILVSCDTDSKPEISVETIKTESLKFNNALDSIYDVYVSMSPVSQAYEGIKDNYDQWGLYNDSVSEMYHNMAIADVAFVKENFNPEKLDKQSALTYRMWLNDNQEGIDNYKWRYHNYPVNQMFGSHKWFATFLMNVHQITNVKDAEDWIARVSKVDVKINELIDGLKKRNEKGIIAPKFVYPYVIQDCENLINGYPFERVEKVNPLLADFKMDLGKIDSLSDKTKNELISNAEVALLKVFQPAYLKLIEVVKETEALATEESGIWKLPQGEEYYKVSLRNTTTTEMTPQEIFDVGMSEIDRIHIEMEKIAENVGFEGDLYDFFDFMKNDKQFYYENTDAGRQAYLDKNIVLIDAMKARLDELFLTKPKAKLEVRRVEPFREKSAGVAFYNGAAPDGSRPGYYYVNLYDMSVMPKYEMEALSFHEAIPGHHMQISIAQELENLPKYRTRDVYYTSYSEGWGLYAEFIPKEIGFYKDPYSDFGRLSMELWRACRLVADVGIHVKKWTREEAIDFYLDNHSAGEAECRKMVERHIVIPTQATAYKVGQMKILSIREAAKEVLGEQFDIREFHDVVLTNGPVPLNILEELVNEWVASK